MSRGNGLNATQLVTSGHLVDPGVVQDDPDVLTRPNVPGLELEEEVFAQIAVVDLDLEILEPRAESFFGQVVVGDGDSRREGCSLARSIEDVDGLDGLVGVLCGRVSIPQLGPRQEQAEPLGDHLPAADLGRDFDDFRRARFSHVILLIYLEPPYFYIILQNTSN